MKGGGVKLGSVIRVLLAGVCVTWAARGAAQASPVWVWRNSGLVKLGEDLAIAGQWSYAGAIDPGGIVYDAAAQALWLNDKSPSGNLYRIRLASPASITKVPMDLSPQVTGSTLSLFAASMPAVPAMEIETKLAAASLDSDAYEDSDTAHSWLFAGGTQRMVELARDGRHLRTIDLAEKIPGMAHPANAFFEKAGGNGTIMVTDGTHLSALLNGRDPVALSPGSFITHLIPEGNDHFWITDCAAKKVSRAGYYYAELEIPVPDNPV